MHTNRSAGGTTVLAGLCYWLEGQPETIAQPMKLIGRVAIGQLTVLYIANDNIRASMLDDHRPESL